MTILFYILGYLAVAGFICMAYLKIRSYMAASPLHVRWELYPVPHEGSKTVYGGSFMEEKDWWTQPLRAPDVISRQQRSALQSPPG